MTSYRGRWTPDDRAASIFQYVPFDVPAGAAAIAVRLAYDGSRGVLDLGVFDPERFRGYSGGARERFVITPSAATPGYLPGELPPGEWRVLLGLHRIHEQGLDFEVAVEVGPAKVPNLPAAPPRPPRPPRRDLPAAPGRRWLAGDLHAHTVHSDGTLTIDQLAAAAAAAGLDFLAVTDHNTTSHHPHLPAAGDRAGVRLLPGQEVTTDSGHANCFGDVGWVDFRRPADDWLEAAEAGGGLLSVNHPLAGDCAWRKPLSRRTPLVEVWHQTWDRRDEAPLRWWADAGGVGVGGSDLHDPRAGHRLGHPTTWVECEGGDVLGGLRAGRVALAADPHGPVVIRRDGELVVDGGDGARLLDSAGRARRVDGQRGRFAATVGPYRIVDDAGLVLAVTA